MALLLSWMAVGADRGSLGEKEYFLIAMAVTILLGFQFFTTLRFVVEDFTKKIIVPKNQIYLEQTIFLQRMPARFILPKRISKPNATTVRPAGSKVHLKPNGLCSCLNAVFSPDKHLAFQKLVTISCLSCRFGNQNIFLIPRG